MSTANGSGGTSSNLARLLVVLALIFSALCAHASAARAQPAGDPLEDQPAEDAVAELLKEVYPGVPLNREVPGHGTLLAIDRAREVLGFVPQHSWRDHVSLKEG